MTLLVAMPVPCKELNPNRLDLDFEPGIIIAADTRFTMTDRRGCKRTEDSGLKVASVGNRVLVGFAGDGLVVDRALSKLARTAERGETGPEPQEDLATQLRDRFHAEQIRAGRHQRSEVGPAMVLLGYRSGQSTYELWRLDSVDDFEPKRRGGLELAGSGARLFPDPFRDESAHMAASWRAQWEGQVDIRNRPRGAAFPEEMARYEALHPLPERPFVDVGNAAMLVQVVLDEVVQDEADEAVGGSVHLMMLEGDGVSRFRKSFATDDDGQNWRRVDSEQRLRRPRAVR